MGNSSSKNTQKYYAIHGSSEEMKLRQASQTGQLETVKEIIKSVNYRDSNDMFGKALSDATSDNYLEIAQLL